MSKFVTIRSGLVAIACALILAACFDILGGGWIWSALGPDAGKATFGFNLHCDQDTNEAWGHITFHDHGVRIDDEHYNFVNQGATWHGRPNTMAFQGEVFAGLGYDFGEGEFGCNDDHWAWKANYIGTYTPVPASIGDGGLFQIAAHDGGEPGPDGDDWIEVLVLSGVYEGYWNLGELQGGDIHLPE